MAFLEASLAGSVPFYLAACSPHKAICAFMNALSTMSLILTKWGIDDCFSTSRYFFLDDKDAITPKVTALFLVL